MTEDSITDGAWDISATFAPALLERGVKSTRSVLERWWAEGVTDEELAVKKQGIIGSYAVGLANTQGLAAAILTALQRGYDVSWLDGYPEAVRALTREQVNRAIQKHLDPAKLVLVEAGSFTGEKGAP